MTERYEKLKEALPEIAELVKLFPESLQSQVLEVLLSELQVVERKKQEAPAESEQISSVEVQPQESSGKKISKVARPDETSKEKFKLIVGVKGLKANSARDAAKRAVYVALRAHHLITGGKQLSWKNYLLPLLGKFNLYESRGDFYSDSNLDRDAEDDDLFSLDTDAQQEADKFIEEIQSEDLVRDWKPKPKSGSKAKTSKKKSKTNKGKDSK